MNLSEKENLEIDYWRESKTESAREFKKINFLNKTQECKVLDYKFSKYKSILQDKKNVLEIGAGQGWASCFLKRFYLPTAKFTVTDISDHAIASLSHWENVFDVSIDNKFAAKSYEINAPDESFDLIFCFASAHHFVLHKQTLIELKRLLKPDGHICFFYEPTSSRLFYPLHKWYVNKIAHKTPEDVLIPHEMKKISKDVGLNYSNHYDSKQIILRSIATGMYFSFLNAFSFLEKVLPSSSDLIFTKKL